MGRQKSKQNVTSTRKTMTPPKVLRSSEKTIIVRVFTYAARKRANPFKTLTVPLHNNKYVRLDCLRRAVQADLLHIWNDNGVVMLEEGADGRSVKTFVAERTYDIKAELNPTFDRQEAFSSVSWQTVQQDFNLVEENDGFSVGKPNDPPTALPSALAETLRLIAQRHTLRAEASRRTVISLLLLFAMKHVDASLSKPFLVLDDELFLREVRKTAFDMVQYSGSVDFVVGHSQTPGGLAHDTALLVVEAKKVNRLREALAQTVAEACVVLDLRREKGRGHGEYRTYFLVTEGLNWIAGYVRPGNDGRNYYCESDTIQATISGCLDEIALLKVFSMLIALLERSKGSTPRGSAANVNIDVEDDPDVALEVRAVAATDCSGNRRELGGEDDEDDDDEDGDDEDGGEEAEE